MNKPDDVRLDKELELLDIVAEWHGVVSRGKIDAIGFDDDSTGNGNGPYIRLRLYKTYARFDLGDYLTDEEKQRKFHYKDYKTLSDFAEDIAGVTRDYFFSYYKCNKKL